MTTRFEIVAFDQETKKEFIYIHDCDGFLHLGIGLQVIIFEDECGDDEMLTINQIFLQPTTEPKILVYIDTTFATTEEFQIWANQAYLAGWRVKESQE